MKVETNYSLNTVDNVTKELLLKLAQNRNNTFTTSLSKTKILATKV